MRRTWYGDIDTDLTRFNIFLKALGRRAGAGEDSSAVAVLIRIDEIDSCVQSGSFEADEDGAEDFFRVAFHVRLDARDDRGTDLKIHRTELAQSQQIPEQRRGVQGAYKIAIGIFRGHVTSPIEQDLSALLFGAGNQPFDPRFALRTDDGTEISAFFEPTIDLESLRALRKFGEPGLRLADHNEGAQCHTALARGTESSARDGV